MGAALAAALVGPASADERDYIGLFGGNWSGSGSVLNDAQSWHFSCRASGNLDANRLTIQGRCRVALMEFPIVADIAYDATTGQYAGTYTGGNVGPAEVWGRRNKDTVNLEIAWPTPVNGDERARMTILNRGDGSFQVLVSDKVVPGGPEQLVSELSLTKL